MLSSEIIFDIHIASLWYQPLEMLSNEILFDIHIASRIRRRNSNEILLISI